MMASMSAGGPGDPHTQMNTYRSYVTMLADPGAKDEIKLKAAQELSENFEVILSSPQYPQFLDHSLKIFLKILQEGEPHFIAEYNIQQVRKLILEMIHRLPISETLRPYVKSILILMLKLMEIENEENVLVCLKIFMELHKQYRPPYSTEVDIHKFLQWVKGIYSDLPNHLPKIFEPKPTIRVKDLSEVNIEQLLQETYTTTPIHTEKKLLDGSVVTYNLIPRSVLSLKVIQELPIIVVLMYQLYKQNVHQEVSNFIPLIMETITLQPAANHRQSASFNKEVFVDFMGAQIKTLAFLAYIIRIYQDTIANHASLMVKGIIGLLTLCPPEVAHLRKELVIATRHILATDLRLKFVPYMERLFDEDVLLGDGWTVHETLRPLAYSTLADLVHHVRQHLPLTDLAIAAHLFSKNVHDESLPTSIQTMSCKLLLNLVDCIRQRSESEGAAASGAQPQGRQLLMRILEVFVLKFKTISKLQLPALMAKCKMTPVATNGNGTTPSTPTILAPVTSSEIKLEEEKPTPDLLDSLSKPEEKSKIGFPSSQLNNLNVGDYRTLVKTLVCGVKTITWGCASCKTAPTTEGQPATTITGQKQLSPRETLVFIRLVRWGLQSLDIYTLCAPRAPVMPPAMPHVRSKEEKEVLEHFSGVFSMMNPQTFQEIFTATISHMVERINKNMTLQIIANTFLSNPATSPIFATVLVEYLLKRMEEMGTNVERSNLYLRLFKLVFGSVSLFPTENEQMLRPHLHSIVNKAMDYAMTAKEPYNYFLLLRALFRSIGGGSHDLLYQEFLPLLPNLLEGLNRLQSGLHKQHMKDLFVELCLTVPVRLSSLLPYLPMLMDPLVSALNGSHTLISQGLRTLELCVDNLQPDFLYEHIQPVRADLMQALWRTLQNNEVARIAFRVLGKFGGGNRKMMIEPQRLEYRETDAPPPAVQAYFQDQSKPLDFEVDKVIETAFSALKSSTTDPFYRRQCWEVLRCYLASSLNLDDDKATLQKLFNHPSFLDGKIITQNGPYYKCTNTIVRNTHRTALTGMFVAAAIKELRHHVLPTMVSLVRHYTLVAIAQEAGPFAGSGTPKEGLDPLVLIDAIAVVMGHEEKELCKPGHLALVLMIETAATVLGGKERACRLPLMEYLAERMSALCYERAWYAKLGGCIAVKFMFEKMAPEWVYKHVFTFLKAVLFVMMDLTGEVSSGAIDMATVNLERLVRVCVTGPAGQVEPEGEVAAAKARALHDVLQELVLQVTSPHLLVRQQAMKSLELIAELQGKTVTEVMDPHREVLADIIPPKKHLLRHQPANAQMGLMDGTTFCTTLKPRLFTIDLNINEHKVFFRELLSLCEAEDAMLGKLPCYKGVNLVPLRASALRALAACHYIQEKHCREKIFQVLYKSLEKNDTELQQAGFECMQKFLSGFQIDMEMVHPVMRPLLLTLGDHRNLSVNGAKRLSYLTQLFPSTFSEKLCEQLLQLLKKLLDYSIQTNRGGNFLQSVSKNMENEQKIIILIGIFHQIPAASPRFIDVLCRLIFHTEKSLMVEAGSPFREPLVKFLIRYPKETLDLIMMDNNIKDQQWSRFLIFLIKHPEAGGTFREALQTSKKPRLMQLLATNTGAAATTLPQADRAEMQFQAIRAVSLLIKFDDQWMSTQHDLMEMIKRIWCNDQYHESHKKVENIDCTHWKEPKLIVKILLHYFCHHPNNIELLFQLLRAFCDRFIPDFQFLRDFLENTVAQNYTVEWKRSAFFRFVEHFSDDSMSQELKAKVLQMILIPCFAISFDKGQKIVGGAPAPYHDSPDNIVSVFINNVIDPENPFACSDAVRISLLQFACLLLEQASAHIHDANNKKQGNKLRRLMTFAWPCLLGKNYVDPATRYHGHLLLSHIIAKFAIHKRIVLQVFHSLLKAHAVEARSVVRQALEILTPAMPQRMEDGNTMLTHWTKKIIVEDGHSVQQLFHILQLVVRHYKVYYPVRHALVGHMVAAMQRLGFSATASLEHRRLAVDLAEVALKWELQRIRDHTHDDNVATSPSGALKRISSDDSMSEPRKALNTGWASPQASVSRLEPDAAKPLDRQHVDVVVNLLLRLACQVNEGAGAGGGGAAGSPGEQLSRRCVLLLKAALKPDVWPHLCEPKLAWLDKVFATADSNAAACANACTALELLVFLLTVLRRDQALVALKPLQRGLAACVASNNAKIVRLTHNLLAKLTALFPTEPTGVAQVSKYEELETLYACVSKYAFEGLATYEKSAPGNAATALHGPLMMLKACCSSNPGYIDRLVLPLMRVLHRMVKDHVSSAGGAAAGAAPAAPAAASSAAASQDPSLSDLLILALDLLKGRVSVMAVDTRKTFIGTVLVGLIEKTTDPKVMKAITRMVEEWVKSRSASVALGAGAAPSLREKSILLVKLMQYVEKRFPDDLELNAHFLDIINYVYRDEHLKMTELSMKLEPAFLAGLRCPQPHIRAKFFEVYDTSVRRRIFDRLLYIICSQNWEHIGQHFWIKQCLELLLVCCVSNSQIRLSNTKYLLPSITAVINWADSEERKSFVIFSSVKEESSDGFSDSLDPDKEDVLDMDLDSNSTHKEDLTKNQPNRQRAINQIVCKQSEFLELARRVRTEQLVAAAAQLCHMDDVLAHHTWLRLFPKLWSTLDDRQLGTVMNEIVPFIISGIHVIQRDQPQSALNSFIEALARCNPPITIKPPMMKYLGKTHNLWHRMTLNLEQMAIDQAAGRTPRDQLEIYDYDTETTTPTETLDSLSDMYELLQEEDMWSGLWQKHARYRETNVAIAYEQQGFFEQAQAAYDVAMAKLKQDYTANPTTYNIHKECTLWTQHWIKCARELNQWDSLLDLGLTRGSRDPFLILESSWRNPNWPTMKDALAEVEYNCPKELSWVVNLYRGYLCICAGGEQQVAGVERHAEAAAAACLRDWRRLPRLVSHAHLPLLRAAQQLMELSEAAQIHSGLLHSRPTSLHDMKAIVKTWRNRLPVVADPLSHWGAIFTWRQHHYQFIASHYDSQTEHAANHSMLGVHASAQAIIHFAKIARKHNLSGVCLDSLHRIYTIPSVPIVDCFQKIRQQVKCHIQMSWTEGKDELQEGLDMIESTNFKYFTKEMTAEFYAFKGLLLAQLGRSEDANKAFAAAVQLHDTLVKAWALWGDYLEQIFIRDPRQVQVGVSAMTCFLHACRHQNESKSRKYCAKVLWMLSFDDEKNSLAEALDKYSVGVPPVQWLPWIPQLLACLVQYDGNVILNLLSHVGRLYPQAVYFPIRTLYLTLKIEQRERHKSAETLASHVPHQTAATASHSKANEGASSSSSGSAETGPIKATLPMWRCSKIMQLQREIHPTVLSSLEGIVDQMVWFRENWYEEVLRQLRAGLAKCHVVAFHHRAAVADATVTPHTLNFIKKVVSTFGIGIGITASESLARRAQATVQDPVFQKMKSQFTADFDFTQPNAMKLQNLIQKLRKWVKILEAKTKVLPKSFLIEEKCRFLSNFSLKTAEVELPGECLLPKHTHYHVRIARFMPRVEIVQKHNTSARRLYIRGHNGKIYPYLVVNDSGLGDARREERVLQLLRMLNHYLGKQKETSRRFLHFTVPRVVSVSPQMRLVEDNPSSISLLDIYRTECANRGVEYDAPVARYYERLAAVQARGSQASHQVLRDILREVQATMVPKGMLREWAAATFAAPTDYWTFRKMLTLQLALSSFAEYVLHLTRLNPDMMYVHQDSGLLNVSYYKFDVDDTTGELDGNRPVPFRLTPNISELLTTIGITGPLTASCIAVARCLVTPNFKIQSILRTILRDEMVTGYRKRLEDKSGMPSAGTSAESKPMEMDNETIINMVNKAVTVIMNRLNSLAQFDGPDSKVATLVTAANSHDNLCRMDPAWHPWL
ncbi:transcription-associated protein 1 isoform X2 [Pectinophora gossypiella]|uniref:transcription-associated protein 1 isoform X2 n=1 Tax=Pectinophora gossypiella TaxID=13191 RepID=UPI00214F57BD|nr:transcription-associated protein 1 isoform X2 [Pectinophora gossypiella]